MSTYIHRKLICLDLGPAGGRWVRSAPGEPQTAPEGPKTPPEGPRRPRRAPQDGPDGPKMAQDVPKMVHRRAKRSPRGPKRAPRGVPEGPERQNSLVSFRYLKDLGVLAFSGKPLETSPKSGRERACAIPHGGSPWGCCSQRLARDILTICSERRGVWTTKHANRLRHHHNLGANGPVQFSLAAPPLGC